jgi:hypothetical protein
MKVTHEFIYYLKASKLIELKYQLQRRLLLATDEAYTQVLEVELADQLVDEQQSS